MTRPASPRRCAASEDEREQLLYRWNDTASEFPDRCVHELFEQQAKRYPDAIAVVGRGQQLSYDELNRRANQLAHHLRRRGVGPESLVGVCLERSPEMVVALLGVWKAGGAYVPLDAAYPPERLAFMVSDAEVQVLLTEERCRALFSSMDDRTICMDSDWPAIAGEECENLSSGANSSNLAYVIYTSGSTGKPKGAMILHRGLVNYLWWAIREYGVRKGGSVPLHSSISFDLTITSLYPALLAGATVEMLEEGVGAQNLLAALRRRKDRDLVKITPAHLELLGQQLRPDEVAGMTNVFVIGGENLLADGLRLWRGSAPETRLVNEYGPTETVVGCCVYQVRPDDPQTGPVPIGRPIANTQLYILNEALQPVSVGAMGELYIGGAGVARGYLNRPELTTERFLPDPFSGRADARMYKTGDLARYRPDGVIEYLGRADDQVKIQGYRIELGEIEAVLASAPSVQSSVVLAREDIPGEKQLVAYLVPGSARAPSAAELLAHLKRRLPEYMVPAKFVSLPLFPLTQNGKIDRRALPAPTAENTLAVREMVRPHGAMEKAVAAVFSEILNVEEVGLHDDFFDLGGRSLLAIKAISRLRDLFGVGLTPERLFEKPTVAELAALLASEQGKGKSAQRIQPREQKSPAPLSSAQQPLWILHQLNPDSPAYNVVDVVRFAGACDVAALRAAVQELVRRHEILRTCFSESGDRPVQEILPAVEMQLAEVDLSRLQVAERESTWRATVREEGRKLFDLTQPPLLRATLVHWDQQEDRLLLVIHHILADEWSMEVIQRELHLLYDAFVQGLPSPLAELPIQYADFAVWQRQRQGELSADQLGFWKQELAGASGVLELATDRPRPATQSFRGATEAFSLPRELTQQLKSLARQEQATLFMSLEASFAALLYRYTGQNDILVGTPISGRTLSETEDLIGCFLNPLVLRSKFVPRASFRSLLQQARERALGAYAHSELPFDRLVAELAPERDASRTPLFQVMFILHDSGGSSQVSKVSGNRELGTGTSKLDLTMVLSETGDSLDGLIEYSTDLFEAETIRAMCSHYATLLAAMVREPDRALTRLAMLPPEESRNLLVEWNPTAKDFPREFCLHHLLAEQAGRTPERVAAVFGDESLNYAELDRRSSQLAQHLRSLGAGPDVLVGLLAERSLEMLVGLLGILKAGSAYVPLDPSFPPNRLAYMVEDSRMSILVTHRGLEETLAARPPVVVRMDADAPAISSWSDAAPAVAGLTSQHLAYVLYTSGSTGKPKGVAIPHAAIVNFLISMQQAPGFSAADTLLAVTTLSFDIAGLELYLPLLSGGKVVIASSADAQDPSRLMELIGSSRCTVLQATPATFRALIDAGWKGRAKLKLLCGGEAMVPDLAAGLLARCGELWNMYGPTETTVWSSIHRVHSAEGPVSIGCPIANTQLYVLDAHGNLAPIGITGELYIGGDGLARGYLHGEELTAERFVPDPFCGRTDARMYKTGDLARWRRDGTMECLGRVDSQVKVRGFRIELGEVESILSACPGVRQCAVILRADATGGRQLAAYYECQAGQSLKDVELRAHLAGDLPGYMLPSVFVAVNKLPLTPNGKIDRKALAASSEHIAVERQFVPPSNELEQMLAQIWARVLKVGKVGVTDNFFELGGHSLLAVRLIVEIEKLCHVRLPLATLLQTPTIAALAAHLGERSWKPSWRSLVLLRPGESRPPLFLMHAHGGNTLEYHALASLLESDQPVYALQARGLDGHIVGDCTIEEMAAAYIEEIRSVQGEGPYYLAGFCFGGLLALEAAQQLTAAGHEVPLLILIQSMHPQVIDFRPDVGRLQRVWYKVTKRLDLELENLSNLSYRGGGYALERFRFVANRIYDQTVLRLADVPTSHSADLSRLSVHTILEALGEVHSKASAKYVPRPYDGNVLLFRASKQMRGLQADDLLGWGEIFSGRVEVLQVSGHQQSILLRPHVASLAALLSSRLEAAQRADGSFPISISRAVSQNPNGLQD